MNELRLQVSGTSRGFFTSPRLRGEVGLLASARNPGEGAFQRPEPIATSPCINTSNKMCYGSAIIELIQIRRNRTPPRMTAANFDVIGDIHGHEISSTNQSSERRNMRC